LLGQEIRTNLLLLQKQQQQAANLISPSDDYIRPHLIQTNTTASEFSRFGPD
jgi:hypothetical protein